MALVSSLLGSLLAKYLMNSGQDPWAAGMSNYGNWNVGWKSDPNYWQNDNPILGESTGSDIVSGRMNTEGNSLLGTYNAFPFASPQNNSPFASSSPSLLEILARYMGNRRR